MQLSLIENGLDSLRKGYTALTEYETLMDNSKSEYEKSITLKSALINTHHGIEILMNGIVRYSKATHSLLQISVSYDFWYDKYSRIELRWFCSTNKK